MRRAAVAATLVAVALFLALATHTKQGGWNDASRLAMIEAIVEHGHLWIDGTYMSRFTGDICRIDGKFYSDKPPALAFAGVPVYAVETALGITFRTDLPRAYYWTTLIVIGGTTIAGLVVLALFLRRIVPDPWWRAATVLAVGLGTLNTAYTVTFSNHPPSAMALLVGFLLLWRWRRFDGGLASVAGSALMTGLSALTDHGAAFYFPAFLAYLLWPGAPRRREAALVFVGAAALPILGYMAYATALSGSPLPLPLQPRLFDYPGSYFADHGHLAGSALTHGSLVELLRYVGLCLIGYRGLFIHTPTMLFVVWGAFRIAASPGRPHRAEAIVALVPTLVLVTYYLLTSTDPGGNAYGVRWFCLFMPILYVFMADGYAELRSLAARVLFWVAYALSFPLAWIGAWDPWLDPTPYGTSFSWVIVLRAHGLM